MARPLKKITEQNLNRIQQKIKKLDLEIDEICMTELRTALEDGTRKKVKGPLHHLENMEQMLYSRQLLRR